MNVSRPVRLIGLILIISLITIIVSVIIVPRLPGELPAWLPWVVGIIVVIIGVVADLVGLFGREPPTVVQVQPPPEPITPLDLPPDLPTWTGREADTQWLLDQLRQDTDVVAITGILGMGGIGKSALAVHVAHQVNPDDFPDGILWLDLRGAQLDVLLASIAGYYGQRQRVDDEPTLERKAAVVRSILARKRALLILDNADSSEQLDLLLPGEGPCITIVTTRHRNLRALRGAATRPLEEMTPAEARALFVKILGRPPSEEEASQVSRLHELLEGLPLALDLAASRLREWRRPWAEYLAAVSDALRSLAMLEDPEDSRSVRAAFALSYHALEERQQALFRALGALHSPTFAPATAAALANVEVETAHDTLERFVTLSLVEPPAEPGGRYRLHALLAAYASELLRGGEAEAALVAERHAGYFLTVAQQYTLEAYNEGLWASYDVDWPDVVAGADWALARLAADDREAAEWVHRYVAALTQVGARRDHRLGLRWFQAGIQAAQILGDQQAEAARLNNIGLVYSALGKKQEALKHYLQALPLMHRVGDWAGKATTLNNIGGLYSDLGEKPKALDYFEQALELSCQVGDRAGEATTLNNMGHVYSDLGEKQKALENYQQALPIMRQVGDRASEATTLNNIGLVYDDLGEKQKALEYYQQALHMHREMGNWAGEATTLNNIGRVYFDLGEKQKALECYEQALSIMRHVGDGAGEAAILNNVGRVYDALGDKQKALDYYQQALPLQRQVGDRAGEATTLNNIGLVYSALGDKQKALDYYQQALELVCQVGDQWHESMARFNIAMIYADLDELDKAEEELRRVVALGEATGYPYLKNYRAALAQVQALRQRAKGR